jgi:hypothetical protein
MIWRGQATDSGTASRHRANVTTQAAGGAGARVCRALFADWAAVDPAGEAAAGDAVAGVLFASRRHSAGSRRSQGKRRPASVAVIQLTSGLDT